jgi:LL-diaminopimelate aminotransferase
MAHLNPNFSTLDNAYLFPEIAKRKELFLKENPNTQEILNLGIGDISLPVAPSITKAISEAALEMSDLKSFKGYGPENGYPFLREAIIENEYPNLDLEKGEVFISDGSKCDTANVLDIFSQDNIVGISDPSYPVYLESSIVKGMSVNNQKLKLLPCLEENNFLPIPPDFHLDLIFLCSPNNPTGTAFTKNQLKAWVDYAQKEKAIILFDSAYSCFIQNSEIPKSIFEIEGAKDVAIEFRSYSKSLGFTGLRLAYTLIPKQLLAYHQKESFSVHHFWARRQSMKFGGASYPIQRGALAYYSPQGKKETNKNIQYYMQNARSLKKTLQDLGFTCFGGEHSPYIWLQTPNKSSSWDFFNFLLTKGQIIGIPGRGFGIHGEGYFRFSSFASKDSVDKTITRMTELKKELDYEIYVPSRA